MDDYVFFARVKDGLERVTNGKVELRVNEEGSTCLEVDPDRPAMRVVLGRIPRRNTV